LWATALLASIGVLAAPFAVLGLAVVGDSIGMSGRAAVLGALALVTGVGTVGAFWRPTRPLGAGLAAGGAINGFILLLATRAGDAG
jgi:hypothetical protein